MPIFLLAAAAALQPTPAAPAPVTGAQVRTQVTVQIVSAVRFTEEEWRASSTRKERLVRDRAGVEIRLRTIDFE